MARPERYFIGPSMKNKLSGLISRDESTPLGGGSEEIPRQITALPRVGTIMRLGKTTGAWAKNTLATINVWEGGTPPNETQTTGETLAGCVNKFANVATGKWVIVARGANGSYYLIAAECS